MDGKPWGWGSSPPNTEGVGSTPPSHLETVRGRGNPGEKISSVVGQQARCQAEIVEKSHPQKMPGVLLKKKKREKGNVLHFLPHSGRKNFFGIFEPAKEGVEVRTPLPNIGGGGV